MIPIENKDTRPDWNAIRAEYIAGNGSYRTLATKYGVSFATLRKRAKAEGWKEKRDDIAHKTDTAVAQKTVDAAADNAAIAKEIQRLLLNQLLKEVQNLPGLIGSEMHKDVTTFSYGDNGGAKGKLTSHTDGGKRYKLTDLTKAYRDLTEDLPMGDGNDVEDLNPLVELLR